MFPNQPIRISPPAAPAANATVVLFDSTVVFANMGLAMMGITRVKLDFAGVNQPSASGGLIGYKSSDKGATWNACSFAALGSASSLPATVTADTGSDSCSYDIAVSSAADVKFTFTASGTGPTVWAPVITLQVGVPNSSS